MEEQEWRTHARRHRPVRATQSSNGIASPRTKTPKTRLSNHTIASSNKSVLRKNEAREHGAPITASSRWKEMRQAVRIKATIDTDERRPTNAKIADLCEEDREKVAKLVRRIVDITALHDQHEAEFARQRSVLENEIQELRSHAKHDTHEIEDLSTKLKDALEKLREYQERVLVLEESNELEVRHRLETDQTVDLLKLEVDKLRKLTKRQKHEMETKEKEQERKHREEMEQMTQELKNTHELLVKERRERLEEKQKELEDRLHRSVSTSVDEKVTTNTYDTPQGNNGTVERMTLPLNVSSLLNTSAELPDKIKEIMNEWEARVEDALNTTAASITQGARPLRMISTAIQTESVSSPDEGRKDFASAARDVQASRPAQRRMQGEEFDRLLMDEPVSQQKYSTASASSRSSSSPRQRTRSERPTNGRPPSPSLHDRSVTRVLLDDFTNASVLVDDESFEDEVESTIALIDGLQTPSQTPDRTTGRRVPHRKLSLYDSSILEVVDAIETEDSSSRQGRLMLYEEQGDSPTLRIERLMEGLRLREQKLACVGARSVSTTEEPSFLQDVELFNEVRDVYTQHLDTGRRDLPQAYTEDHHDGYDDERSDVSDDVNPTHSARCLSVKEAIEQDMQELLRHERLLSRDDLY